MYRTSFASLRVPDLDDPNMDQALVDLATDIQYQTDRNAARVLEMRRRRGALVENTAMPAMASGAVVTAVFGDEVYDTDNYVDLVANNTRIVVTRGLWLVTGSVFALGGGDLNTLLLSIGGSVFGNITFNQNGPFGSTSDGTSSASGLLYSTAGENVTMTVTQLSPGAGTLISARMAVAKIGNL